MRVLGFGSVQGPDRFGWAVVEALANSPSLRELPPGQVAFERLERPDSTSLEVMRDAELVIIVDAVSSDGPPGQLLRLEDLNELSEAAGFSTHALSLATVLQLARAIGALPPRLIIHGLTIDPGCAVAPQASHAHLDDGIAAAVAPSVEAILADIRAYLAI